MSDFLSRLASRTFNPVPEIRPRVATLFEVPARSTAPLVEVVTESRSAVARAPLAPPHSATTSIGPASESASPPRQPNEPRTMHVAAHESPRDADRSQRADASHAAPEPRAPAEREDEPPRPRRAKPNVDTLGLDDRVERKPARRETVRVAERLVETDPDATVSRDASRTRPLSDRAQVVESNDDSRRPAPPPSRGEPSPPERASASKTIEPRPTRVEASPVAVRVAPLPPRDLERVSAPPEVHVTIGRVEIRAAAPRAPSADAPANQSNARVSLDDYLKRTTRNRR